MEISHSTAMRIVTELSGIIDQRINMMNEKGIIIASTDPERIGMLHEGSRQVLEKKLDALIIHDDDEYPGSKAGLNLPIEMDGRYIGVIGITGKYETIEKHGHIIKKMTEILLLDDALKEQKRLARSVRSRYIQEWVFDGASAKTPGFAGRGLALDIDIHMPRRVMLFTPLESLDDTVESQILLNMAEQCFWQLTKTIPACLVVSSGKRLLLLLPERTERELLRITKELCASVERSCGLHLAVGLDSQAVSGEELQEAYLRAGKALQSSLLRKDHAPVFYKDINLEIFIHDVPKKLKEEYVNKIFSNCTPAERDGYIAILKVYFACNGSIQQAAAQMFLHKNTPAV